MAFLKLIPGADELSDTGKVVIPVDAQKVYLDADEVDYIEPYGDGARIYAFHGSFTPNQFVVKATPAEVAGTVTKAMQNAHGGNHEPCECPEPEPSNEPPPAK